MTFGAMAAWQGWLLLAGSVALASWLFLMKVRPPRMLVASLLLWRRVLDESRALTLWERIRRAVSLVVTVLIALALALAASRPSRGVGAAAVSHGRLLVVIDSSWSMLARTGSGETRWDRAVAEARRLTAAASGDEVALATTADGLVEGPTTDLALIGSGLDRIVPAGGEATSWPRLAGTEVVHFITDGTVARPLDASVVVHSVFEPARNVAITAFDVRPSLTRGDAGDAYLEIANYAPSRQTVHLTLFRGTTAILDRQFDMGPGDALHQVTPLVRGADAALRAHVDAPGNALGIDDEAFAWIDRARPLTVTVVGPQTRWLSLLLGGDPDVRATFVDPSSYHPGQEDVVIFDRWAPREAPTRPALCFAPPIDTPWLAGNPQGPAPDSPTEERRPLWDAAGSHPVVRGVDPLTLNIERARVYRSPMLVPVARSARGTPLVYVSESPARRFVVVTFGANDSNLASAPGFPVLVGNSLEWLARPASAAGRRPGPVSFDDAIVKVTSPRGAPVPRACESCGRGLSAGAGAVCRRRRWVAQHDRGQRRRSAGLEHRAHQLECDRAGAASGGRRVGPTVVALLRRGCVRDGHGRVVDVAAANHGVTWR